MDSAISPSWRLEPVSSHVGTVQLGEIVYDHLAYGRRLIHEMRLAPAIAANLTLQMDAAEEALRQPRLNLAVVGEFSSGKSTFINALLGTELLAAGVEPTTAAAIRLTSGSPPSISGSIAGEQFSQAFTDVDAGSMDETLLETLAEFAPGEPPPTTMHALLAVLTTHPEVSSRISGLEVRVATSQLAAGLTIIDTPGANADVSRHVEVARQIVGREADLTVITVPSSSPLSASLTAFLAETLRPDQLADCVFVVTRMDDLDPQDEHALLDFLRQRIARRLSIDSPRILSTAAGCVVKRIRSGDLTEAQSGWCDRFDSLKLELEALMRSRRDSRIMARVMTLLDLALTDLQRQVLIAGVDLANQAQQSTLLPIRNVASFVSEYRVKKELSLKAEVAKQSKYLSAEVEDTRQAATNALRAKLSGAANKAKLQQVMRADLPSILFENGKRVSTTLDGKVKPALERALREAQDDMHRALAAEFERLRELTSSALVASDRGSTGLRDAAKLGGAPSDNYVAPYQKVEHASTLGAATVGATLGMVFFPGLGGLVGGAIGWGIGWLFSPTFDAIKSQYLEHSTKLIDEWHTQVRNGVVAQLSTWESQIAASFEAEADVCLKHYSALVDAATALEVAERARLDAELERIISERDTLKLRRQALDEMRRSLRSSITQSDGAAV